MARMRSLLLGAATLLTVSACDFIRFPGDGGPPPATPEAGPAVPPGAPGPPPPTAPVTDPYGNGDQPTDTGTPVTDPDTGTDTDPGMTDTPTDPADTPDTGTGDTDLGTDVDTPTDTPADTPDDTTDTADTDTSPPVDTPDVTDDPQPPAPVEPAFSFYGPGALLPGTGEGSENETIFAPDMVFPIKDSPAYLQSMVFTFGGGMVGGDQCDERNFEYPWRDNFCETRTSNRNSAYCPMNKIHQGQDIRVGTPESCQSERSTSAADRDAHEVVAVEDGVISNVGSYSVNLRSGGRIYKYLHLNMKKLAVSIGDTVQAGDTIGYVSNDFGGTPTVLHLHFEITQNNGNGGWDYVPPYTSLVAAYERRENGPGELIDDGDVAIASVPAFVIPEGVEIIE
ncbi:M23 family metallopeptidase [Hyphomonas jannaschiana]|uniref:M23 family peptidase n=1 Tax=Hyphomonas jannaschiana VP2 TaxID=1280952 RepID=A0A059F7W1_9PROT|nr:M23 family metallopeptidase [Hyphomonas jannaschiana]KCZ86675.1 M23 family peptidase [Hyphomonas jannaschiana VP2]